MVRSQSLAVWCGRAGGAEHLSTDNGYTVRTPFQRDRLQKRLTHRTGYTDGLVPELGRRILPIGSGLIATGEIPEAAFSKLLPKNRVYGNPTGSSIISEQLPANAGSSGAGALDGSPTTRRRLRSAISRATCSACFPASQTFRSRTRGRQDRVHLRRGSPSRTNCGRSPLRHRILAAPAFRAPRTSGHKIALQIVGKRDGTPSSMSFVFPAVPFHPPPSTPCRSSRPVPPSRCNEALNSTKTTREMTRMSKTAGAARTNVSSGGAYEAVFGYSRAVRAGDDVHVSNVRPSAMKRVMPTRKRVRHLRSLKKALGEAGAELQHVVRTVALSARHQRCRGRGTRAPRVVRQSSSGQHAGAGHFDAASMAKGRDRGLREAGVRGATLS